MTNQYQINNLESEGDIKQIVEAINNFNSSQIDTKLIRNSSKINLVVKNNKGELLGGII